VRFEKKGVPFFVAKKRRPASTGGLYIASGSSIHQEEVVDRCRVPTPEGPCAHPFFANEPVSKREAHIVECCRRHHDTIMEARAQQHPAIMDAWDPELEAWVNQHAQALIEGRMRV
jgi:hypothetical protein